MDFKNKNSTLLILDVDETLIHATDKLLEHSADFKVYDYHVYKRPFLQEFLEAIKEDFLIAVWSSASDEYVQELSLIHISEPTRPY